ncbi:peroxiredoxin [Microlunatus sp. Y2014]|uniref:peroxiredoxin n=1 Tax=Microlunatus sp. Y2014 TaxID=3418488 RepID=UPI003DA6E10C
MTGRTSPPAVGDPAPGWASKNQYGAPVETAELTGAPALLMFYPYAFTGICSGELRAVQDLMSEFTAHDARVLAISCDSMFSLRVFAEQEDFTFELVSDHWPHGGIASAYGVFDEQAGCALRASFLLDADGGVAWSVVNGIGDARNIADHVSALTRL